MELQFRLLMIGIMKRKIESYQAPDNCVAMNCSTTVENLLSIFRFVGDPILENSRTIPRRAVFP